ncbi:MAG: YafY family transcriptional regulator [Acidimicrobiia bacterium]|nr:YafY family transcriptional regulator [Acidimicrobiia bacterium]
MGAKLGVVLDTSARLLRLLSLLQSRPDWSGPELADRLEVTTRTVRRDVDRLRQLGYPVDATHGPDGGYRLGSGASLPPLLLDDDEATAVALALGATAGGAVRGMEEPALAALAKLDRLLPPPLRARVGALRAATVQLGGRAGSGEVDPEVLVATAQACAGNERMALAYADRDGNDTERRIEPHRLVSTGRRWYLVAFDLDRRAWRTFRVDRIAVATRTGHRFRHDDPPDAAAMVSEAIAVAPYRHTAVVRIEAPADEVRRRVPPTVGVVEADGDDGAVLTTGSDDLDSLAGHLVALGFGFEALEPPELRALLRRSAKAIAAAHR